MEDELNITIHPEPIGSYKIIYVYVINDGFHDGMLKVGDATYRTDKSLRAIREEADPSTIPEFITSEEIRSAAKKRINEQTQTAGIKYELLWAVLAIRKKTIEHKYFDSYRFEQFRDFSVHNVLRRSGVEQEIFDEERRATEWFLTDLETVQEAFLSVVRGEQAITQHVNMSADIVLRPEQQEAVRKTLKAFKKAKKNVPVSFLWNAVPRFGKTLTTFELILLMAKSKEQFRALIVTNRPSTNPGWYEDFQKIMGDNEDWAFGSKKLGMTWDELKDYKYAVYFASIQDLRGSLHEERESNTEIFVDPESDHLDQSSPEAITDPENIQDTDATIQDMFKKNQEVFDMEWDIVVWDESHEGTQTDLAQRMKKELKTRTSLHLSGTPYNIIEDFEKDRIFSWSYNDEQGAKAAWYRKYRAWEQNPDEYECPGLENPYGNLPSLEIRTMDVSKVFERNTMLDPSSIEFKLREFFKVDETKTVYGTFHQTYHPFKYEGQVEQLLNILSNSEEYGSEIDELTGEIVKHYRNFMFGRHGSKDDLAHTVWLMDSVLSAVAMKEMLHKHSFFSDFEVVNATGDNDGGDAFGAVKKAIREHEYTITLTVGKLTTGTTVPEWSGAVIMSDVRSAMLYLQFIFRVKTPGTLNDGRQKEQPIIFDLSPDRTLEVLSQVATSTARNTGDDSDRVNPLTPDEIAELEKETIKTTLKYLPVIIYNGSRMERVDTDKLMRTVEQVYIKNSVDSGFYDAAMFNYTYADLTDELVDIANEIISGIGENGVDNDKLVRVSKSNMSQRQKDTIDRGEPDEDAPQEDHDEWNEAMEALKDERKRARNFLPLMRAISCRIPLLVFAGDHSQSVTLANFSTLIDDESWKEFMPKGFTKDHWERIRELFNRNVFEGSCAEIRDRVRHANTLTVERRLYALVKLFGTFRNPDKETILTQWKVVVRQMNDTLGGKRTVDYDGKFLARDVETGERGAYEQSEIEQSYGKLEYHPKWVDRSDVVGDMWENGHTTMIDLNSKSALYPVQFALSLWHRVKELWKTELDHTLSVVEEWEEWRHIVENNIFVNSRTPYARRVAETMLGVPLKDASMDETVNWTDGITVNATVVDIMQVRESLSEARLAKYNKDGSIGKVGTTLTNEDFSILWQWLFNATAMKTAVDNNDTRLTEQRAARLVEVAKLTAESKDSTDYELLNKLLAEAKAEGDQERFTAVVGNPPYHSENDGQKTHIWHHFVEVGNTVGKYSSFIHPPGWIKGGLRLEATKMSWQQSGNLKKVILNEDAVFDRVGIVETTITFFTNEEKHEETQLVVRNLDHSWQTVLDYESQKFYLTDEEKELESIADRIRPQNVVDSMEEYVKAQRYFGVPSGAHVKRAPSGSILPHAKSGFYKILMNDSIPEYGKREFFWIDIGNTHWGARNVEEMDKWKAVFPAAGDQQGVTNWVLGPKEIHTSKYLSVLFDTEVEAKRFLLYLETDFYRSLMKSLLVSQHALRNTHRNVPALDFKTGEIISMKGIFLDFSGDSSLDDQLSKIYEITDDEKRCMSDSLSQLKDETDQHDVI